MTSKRVILDNSFQRGKKVLFETLFRLMKSSEGKALTPVGVREYGKV